MGLDISVLVVDWERLAVFAPGERWERLVDAAYPDECDAEFFAELPDGWVRFPGEVAEWSALYEFRSTSGSFKAHFWAGERWEDVREQAVPELRAALDVFLSGLFWDPYDMAVPPAGTGADAPGVRELLAGRGTGLLVACPPETVPVLAAAWAVAEPLLDGLKGPHTAHADAPGRWIADHDEFAVLLREWAEVVREAHARGWGIVGLPF
ncbi:hypothetical protein [Streptomyces mobaraensis]|uniref:DUF1877 family protein n=1 Tax=Streptomyces mobaraensis TaxID=35621 RepID=A0A5N5VWX0_STRMB|nr:hypothetical protein [Streptomyces mobaraensis]KAB7833073.1 hypothetical protein FRZ00_34075 [Streptomyces mobaraensis]